MSTPPDAAQNATAKLPMTAAAAGIVVTAAIALACQLSSLSYLVAVAIYESTHSDMGPEMVYMTTVSNISARGFEELDGTADVYTTIDRISYAHGTFTATATSEAYQSITS